MASFPGKSAIAAIVDIPLAVPHTVAGIALLMAFGRRGLIGGAGNKLLGLQFWGSFARIVAAMLFVAAPFTVNAARIGFEAVDPRVEMLAHTLGMGPVCGDYSPAVAAGCCCDWLVPVRALSCSSHKE